MSNALQPTKPKLSSTISSSVEVSNACVVSQKELNPITLREAKIVGRREHFVALDNFSFDVPKNCQPSPSVASRGIEKQHREAFIIASPMSAAFAVHRQYIVRTSPDFVGRREHLVALDNSLSLRQLAPSCCCSSPMRR